MRLIGLAVLLTVSLALAAEAQQRAKIPRIGYLVLSPLTEPPSPERAAFRALDDPGLRQPVHSWRYTSRAALLAIADAAGGAWANLARRAARTLAGSVVEADCAVPVQLLADLRDLFATRAADKLATAAILHFLTTLEDRPWADYAQGEPLTPRQLARLLNGFNIKARQIRQGSATRKGYMRADFIDVFCRYLPSATPKHRHGIADLTSPPNGRRAVVDKDARCARDINHVSDVSDLFDEA